MDVLPIIIGVIASVVALLAFLDQRASSKGIYREIISVRDEINVLLTPPEEQVEKRQKAVRSAVMALLVSERSEKEHAFASWSSMDIWTRVKQIVPGLSWLELSNQLKLMVLHKWIAETAAQKPVADNRYYALSKPGKKWKALGEEFWEIDHGVGLVSHGSASVQH